MSENNDEVMSSPKIHIQTPEELPDEEEYFRADLDKGPSLVFQQPEVWQWGQHQKEPYPRSTTQGNPLQEENLKETDLGCQWANWNINKLAVRPAIRLDEPQDQEELVVPGRPRRRTSRSVEKEPRSPTKPKKDSKFQIIDKEKQERDRRRIMINRVLAGKGSFVWVFVLGFTIPEIDLQPIKNLYLGHIDNNFVSPLCRTFQQAQRFLKVQNYFFKIITDVQNAKQIIKQSAENASIVSIYVYTSAKERGNQFFELKRESKKIKGAYLTLTEAANQVSEDLAEQARFIDDEGRLTRASKPRNRFPAFIVLSGTDNSEVTAYRLCLYGAIKLENPNEKEPYLKQFMELVEARYSEDQRQLKNIEFYKKINHLESNNGQKAQQILNFYVKQTFYYATVNSLLRLARSAEEFRPCAIPFNETYHAIRHYHKISKHQRTSFTAYRGCKLKLSEVNSLAKNTYIQLLGFASSSLDKQIALNFMDGDSYLIEITVDESSQNLSQEDQLYEHGYVNINKHNLAGQSFEHQQEILFNALNIYKVLDIDLKSGIRTIKLKYGGLRELKQKQETNLTPQEKCILNNMAYCVNMLKKIEDQGDLFLLSQEYEKAKEYYLEKVKNKTDNSNNLGKLSHIYMEMGDLTNAELYALKMIETFKKNNSEKSNHSTLTVERIQQASELLNVADNIESYEYLVNLQLNTTSNYLQRSKALIARSRSRIQRGQLKGCLQDLIKADSELDQKQQSFTTRKNTLNREYFLKSLCSCANRQTSEALQRQRQAQLLAIDQQQIDFKSKEDQFYEYKMMIEQIKETYYEKTGEIEKVKESDQKLRKYFRGIKEKDQDLYPVQTAKYYYFQALAHEKKDFAQYESLMQEAIDILTQNDPYNQYIATISSSLASSRHAKLKSKLVYPQISQWMNLVSSSNTTFSSNKRNKARFNYEEHKQFYKKCRNHYKQAINITIYNKGKEDPECLKLENKLAELDYDYSLLDQAEKEAREVTKRIIAEKHSEGAKSYLLLAKIALAKGQLKHSLNMITTAEEILTKVLAPKGNQSVLIKHPLFSQINMTKAKIFNKQSKHQLALQQLDLLQKITKVLIAPHQLHANLLEEKAEVLFCQGSTFEFEEMIHIAIKQRQQIFGKFNIHNAISYSKLSMYARLLGDQEDALKYHSLALQIFSKFSSDHPYTWAIHLSNAAVYLKQKAEQTIFKELQLCLKIAEMRYSHDHINLTKIQLQVGKLMQQIKKKHQALNMYESVDKRLQRQIYQTSIYTSMMNEYDDEKLGIKKDLEKDIKQIYKEIRGTQLESVINFEAFNTNKTLECIMEESKMQSLKSSL